METWLLQGSIIMVKVLHKYNTIESWIGRNVYWRSGIGKKKKSI